MYLFIVSYFMYETFLKMFYCVLVTDINIYITHFIKFHTYTKTSKTLFRYQLTIIPIYKNECQSMISCNRALNTFRNNIIMSHL